jgi:hypothetical protein
METTETLVKTIESILEEREASQAKEKAKDATAFARALSDMRVERAVAFNSWGRQLGTWIPLTAHNMLGEKAVFMLTRR